MLNKFRKTLNELNISKQKVVVAVSGGADSLSLLLLLNEVKNELGLEIICAHFNHNLRGQESQKDAQFVQDLCQKLGIRFIYETWEHPQKSEEKCRVARYEFLAKICTQNNVTTIATGHTKSDLAETFILNLVRGSGAQGLSPLPKLSKLPLDESITLIRPLLDFSGQQTLAFCHSYGIIPRNDSSNEDTNYKRNLVRRNIMPLLQEINSQAEEAILQSASIIEQEHQIVVELAVEATERLFITNEKQIQMPKEDFLQLDSSVAAEVARMALKKLLGSLKDIEKKHIDIILQGAKAKNGSRFILPQGIELLINYDTIVLSADDTKEKCAPQPIEISLNESKPYGSYVFSCMQAGDTLVVEKNEEIFYLSDSEKLTIRPYVDGDRLAIENGSKKISDILGEAKIPRNERPLIPIVIQGDKPAWMCGVRKQARRARQNTGEKTLLKYILED